MKKIKRTLKKVLNYGSNEYEKFLKMPMDAHAVLLEAGQGKNINGNMFYLLKELERNKAWDEFMPYYVVTNENRQAAEDRFAFYGFRKVQLVAIDSKEYKRILATAKYLFTDNSFPAYFNKREEQVYLNTWHGTPIKYLGRSDICNSSSLGNVQKNYFMSDYALFPNQYTKDIFFDDYMLTNFFSNEVVLVDYPRNEILRDAAAGTEVKKALGYEGKEVITYMPTWRGGGRDADAETQTRIISGYLQELDGKLREDQILMVNLHFLVDNNIDYSGFQHIVSFPKEYETYEVLNASDMLITDYSSVFFDYAVSRKKIILFVYDLDEYLSERGMYFDIKTLPFPLVATVDELVKSINTKCDVAYDAFCEKFCHCITDAVSDKLLKLVVSGNKSDLEVFDGKSYEWNNAVYNIGNIADEANQAVILAKLEEMDHCNRHITFIFQNRINEATGAFLKKLPKEISYVRLMPLRVVGLKDNIVFKLYKRCGFWKRRATIILSNELNRIMHKWEYMSVQNLGSKNALTAVVDFINNMFYNV